MGIEDSKGIARKLLPIIYVLDTSTSMEGEKIAIVNKAMKDTVEVLRSVSNKNPTAELKIGVLQFSSGAEWVTSNGLVFLDDYYWNDLVAGGLTDLGSAFEELHKKMSKTEGFFDSKIGYKNPVIIFMSDGYPTDDYKPKLEALNNANKWFKDAVKIAIAIGDEADTNILQEIVGSSEAVLSDSNDLEKLEKQAAAEKAVQKVNETAKVL